MEQKPIIVKKPYVKPTVVSEQPFERKVLVSGCQWVDDTPGGTGCVKQVN